MKPQKLFIDKQIMKQKNSCMNYESRLPGLTLDDNLTNQVCHIDNLIKEADNQEPARIHQHFKLGNYAW